VRIALFGHPVGHSRSADLFGALGARGGTPVHYEALDVPPDALAPALARLRAGAWAGANVTIPHKLAAAAAADRLDELAHRAGAVNVLVRKGSTLIGANTDGPGFLDALDELVRSEPAGARLAPGDAAVLLGAGGAARGVAAALAARGLEVSVVSRAPRRNAPGWRGLCDRLIGWSDPDLVHRARAARLLVQATPIGTAPRSDEAPPLAGEAFRPGQLVVDLIYNPWETLFLRRARARGALALNGWPMLVHQAARALELWAGGGREDVLAAAAALERRDPLGGGVL
jgi:shikimate dehydrogenase